MTVAAFNYRYPAAFEGWADVGDSLRQPPPVIRLVAETSEEERRQFLRQQSAKLWEETVSLVRSALQQQASYAAAWALVGADYIRLQQEIREVGVSPSRALIRRQIQARVGADWLEAMDRGERFMTKAAQLWKQPLKPAPRVRDRERFQALWEEYRDHHGRFGFAFLTLQIVAHEEISLGELDDLADDLIYPPRTVFLNVCEGAALRGGDPFLWLDLVYELDAQGESREALGLLMEGVMRCPPRTLPGTLSRVSLERLSTICLQGFRTVAAGHSDRSAQNAAQRATSLLEQRYRGS